MDVKSPFNNVLAKSSFKLQHKEALDLGYSSSLHEYISLVNYIHYLKRWGMIRNSSIELKSPAWLRAILDRDSSAMAVSGSSSMLTFYQERERDIDQTLQQRRKKELPSKPQISKDATLLIRNILKMADDHKVVSRFGIDFDVRDLRTLRSPNWLNDEVINFYLQLVMERSENSQGKLPTLHVFSSFFFPKLRDRGYESVKSSTRKVKSPVLNKDIILFPIHLGMHWCMASIDFRKKTIKYYDSLHGSNQQCLDILRNWIASESIDKCKVEYNFTGWVQDCPNDIPAQQNGYDCGVFSLIFAEYLSRDAPFDFSQNDMFYYRDKISLEIIKETLLYY